jgi:hypothetical protein
MREPSFCVGAFTKVHIDGIGDIPILLGELAIDGKLHQ